LIYIFLLNISVIIFLMKNSKIKGFTILEVIIVLVIGAIIMIAVFLVVPQLQLTQRNSRRANEARRALTAFGQYLDQGGSLVVGSDNYANITWCSSGTGLGGTVTSLIEPITGQLKTPEGGNYIMQAWSCVPKNSIISGTDYGILRPNGTNILYFFDGAKCASVGGGNITANIGNRAILYPVEPKLTSGTYSGKYLTQCLGV
jgi:prepilin-type N-terminal cleavage/methylation domain-containing protein